MATPFIDVLTDSQRQVVAKKSKGAFRPSYFSATIAQEQAEAQRTGSADPSTIDPNIQISLDLEAALILMPSPIKQALLQFIDEAIHTSANRDDLYLLNEVVAVRGVSFTQQTVPNVSATLISYDQARQGALGFIAQVSHQQERPGSQDDPGIIVIPDLSNLFSTLLEDFDTLAKPDSMAVHDIIADSATLFSYSSAGQLRAQELSSWTLVITTYNL